MTGNRSADQDVILIRKDLHNLQALHLYTVATHPARHTNTLHNAARVGRVTQRTRSTLTIMLTVRLLTYPMESMTLNDTLKTFTFRRADYFDLVAFGKDVHGNGFTKSFFYGVIAKFFYKLFGRSAGFGEVIFFCCSSVLFFLFAER